MNDQPMNDKLRCNLATITRKVLRQVCVYEYIKTDSKSGELDYKQLCNVRNLAGPYKRNLMVQHPCVWRSHLCMIDTRQGSTFE